MSTGKLLTNQAFLISWFSYRLAPRILHVEFAYRQETLPQQIMATRDAAGCMSGGVVKLAAARLFAFSRTPRELVLRGCQGDPRHLWILPETRLVDRIGANYRVHLLRTNPERLVTLGCRDLDTAPS